MSRHSITPPKKKSLANNQWKPEGKKKLATISY